MGAILLAALRHPFAGRDSARKLVAGSLLNLVPILNLLALGYALRLMRQVLAGEETQLPAWEDWGGLFLDGIRVLVVGAAFAVGPLLLHWLGAGEVLTVLAFGLAAALEPMALVRLASFGRLSAAFEIGKVWQDVRLLFSGYLPAVLAWLAALFGFGVLLVGTRPPIAWILHGFVGFYLYLFFAALFGRVGSRTRMLRLTFR
ncbi:MAG: DUF4013 domain-containing protein [candidate division NC10 bacterium]|nr:DUF4013 domain-containing protein [candidate division NC10 bacterium]